MADDLTDWKAARLAALTAPDGWLNLTDRVALKAGSQSVGTAPDNAIVLSAGPAYLGVLTLIGENGHFQAPSSPALPFITRPDTPPQLMVGSLLLELHKDADEIALRLRDLTVKRTVELAYFPTSPDWIIRAKWHEFAAPVSQSIAQKGGATTTVRLTHAASFRHAGHDIVLLATHWKASKPMFVIRDATSGIETYAASRFLIGEHIGDGLITLDFNCAFNPPCAFSDFAICPLPPRENILPFAIRAGEMKPITKQG